jgi:long-chain fatty acid transport protein
MELPASSLRSVRVFAVAASIGSLLCQQVSATGFFINQQSVRGLGRVDAGNTVTADDLATVFFNPAGLINLFENPKQPRIQVSFGVHVIVPGSDLRNQRSSAATPGTLGRFVAIGGGNAHNATPPSPVPNIYYGRPLTERLAAGVGVTFPFGLKTTFDPDWFGRYDATRASLLTPTLSAVAAFRLDCRLTFGGGLDLQYASSVLAAKIPDPLAPGGPSPATDGTVLTKGHAFTTGFDAGVIYDVRRCSTSGSTAGDPARVRLGAHYRSGMNHEISGHSTFSGLSGPLAGQNGRIAATAQLDLPAIATAGARVMATPKLALLGEFEFYDWSSFKEIRIQFADGRPDGVRPSNYRDAYAVAVGAEYSASDRWTARGGVHHDTTPTVDGFRDSTVPDAARLWLGLGASWQQSRRYGFDVAFNHVFFRDTTVDVTRSFFENTPLASTVGINSDVTSAVNTLSFALRVALR